jgi:hypothetical protein
VFVHGLLEKESCADGKCLLHGLSFIPPGHDNNRRRFIPGRLADQPCQIEAIQVRHLQVQENPIKSFLIHQASCFLAIADRADFGQHARGFHTATLLPDGKVLMAGGAFRTNPTVPIPCFGGMPSTELYDPVSGSFTAARNMDQPRYNHTATLLLTGQVLVTGGIGVITSLPDCDDGGNPPVWNSAELYDPSNGSFATTGSMIAAREAHTASLLAGGKVLIAGGTNENFVGTKAAEIYDPHTGVFSSTANMGIPRSGHTATVLANVKVLIAGGIESGSQPFSGVATAKAEIYDPGTGSFSPTSNMTAARAGHTATLLATGLVLIAGGSDLPTAELYDPATGTFSRTGDMGQARGSHIATLLPTARS